MRALRYAIYCYLFSATVYSAVIHNQVLSSSLCLLVVLPALVHTTIQGGLAWARFAHVLEAVALPALLYALNCAEALLYPASISLVVCNGLLWRVRLTLLGLGVRSYVNCLSVCSNFVG